MSTLYYYIFPFFSSLSFLSICLFPVGTCSNVFTCPQNVHEIVNNMLCCVLVFTQITLCFLVFTFLINSHCMSNFSICYCPVFHRMFSLLFNYLFPKFLPASHYLKWPLCSCARTIHEHAPCRPNWEFLWHVSQECVYCVRPYILLNFLAFIYLLKSINPLIITTSLLFKLLHMFIPCVPLKFYFNGVLEKDWREMLLSTQHLHWSTVSCSVQFS